MEDKATPREVGSHLGLGPLPPTTYVLGRESDGYSPDRLLSDAGYTEEHMRAYAAQEVAAERERCAKLCDDISDEYQRREGGKYAELRSDAEEGASKCAAAIRVA